MKYKETQQTLVETIVVKIENAYISLGLIREDGDKFRLAKLRRASLPEDFGGYNAPDQPERLVKILTEAIKSSGMQAKNLAVYFGSGLEQFTEYRLGSTLDEASKRRRAQQEVQKLISGADAHARRIIYFRYPGEEGELSASSVFVTGAEFCVRLVHLLEKEGYTVTALSSSLVAFAGIAGLVSDIGSRVLVLNAEKKEFQAALFTNGKLARISRISGGTEALKAADQLLPLINNDTKIVICGFESQDKQLREFLKKTGAAAVGSVNQKMKGPQEKFSLAGELSYQQALFPGIFSAAALPAGPSSQSYLPEKQRKKKPNAWITAICIVAFLVALFICIVPPLTLMSAEKEYALNKTRLEDPFFAAASEKLNLYRTLVSENTELSAAEEKIPERDPSYADAIDELMDGLLRSARIEEMFFEKGRGLFIDFTLADTERFDKDKIAVNDGGKMMIYEPSERREVSEGVWRIQLRVTINPTFSEDTR